MSRDVPVDQPLSDEDREYLHTRGYHDMVDRIDRDFPGGGTPSEVTNESFVDNPEDVPDEDQDDYDSWTSAELETELKNRNLAYSGTNAQKIQRLRADDAARAQQ